MITINKGLDRFLKCNGISKERRVEYLNDLEDNGILTNSVKERIFNLQK